MSSSASTQAGIPQVDHVHRIEAEIAQVLLDLRAQLLRGQRLEPAAIGVSLRPDLGDDMQVLGCIAPYPMRVTVRSPPTVNVPPGCVVAAIRGPTG